MHSLADRMLFGTNRLAKATMLYDSRDPLKKLQQGQKTALELSSLNIVANS